MIPDDIRHDIREIFLDAQNKLYGPTLSTKNLMSGYHVDEENDPPDYRKNKIWAAARSTLEKKPLLVHQIAATEYKSQGVSDPRIEVPKWIHSPNHVLLFLHKFPDLPKQLPKWTETWDKIERYWLRRESFDNNNGRKNPDAMAMSRLRNTGNDIFYETIREIPEYLEQGDPAGHSVWEMAPDPTMALAQKFLTPDEMEMVNANVREFCGQYKDIPAKPGSFHVMPEDFHAYQFTFMQEWIVEKLEMWAQENLAR
jgi:hypothetical protein